MEQSNPKTKDKQPSDYIDNAEIENAESSKSGGKARSALKTTGKVIGKGLGFDVIFKDSKRLKSRFPNLWADIFSGRWRDVDSEHREPSNASKTASVAFTLTLMTLAMAGYWTFLLIAAKQQDTVGWMPLIALGILVAAGTFQSACYWYIARLQSRQEREKPATSKAIKGGKGNQAAKKEGRTV